MKKVDNIRLYAWLEFAIWLIIIAICVFGIRYYQHVQQKQFKSYQIFMSDVDGLIVGSPVRFLGIQIGHVTKIQILSSEISSDIYVRQFGDAAKLINIFNYSKRFNFTNRRNSNS